MLRALSLRRAKKKVIGLKGSSYNNQEVFDITNANALTKIFGMIPFTYEKHLKENNSIKPRRVFSFLRHKCGAL